MSESNAAAGEPAAPGAIAGTTRVEELRLALERLCGGGVSALPLQAGEPGLELPAADLLRIAATLRDAPEYRFEMCMDVCGLDYLEYGRAEWKTQAASSTGFSRGRSELGASSEDIAGRLVAEPSTGRRFAVVYHLLSISLNQRVRLRVFCPDDGQPVVDSVTGIWASADWFERETFDLFGILFRGHPDLRRLLTDYGFIGHPFRKDFPLSGHVEVRYDPEKRRVIYQPVTIDPRVLVPKVIRRDNRYDPQLTNAPPAAIPGKANG
jgi:NADH-quinone oxidoreductase subunit C